MSETMAIITTITIQQKLKKRTTKGLDVSTAMNLDISEKIVQIKGHTRKKGSGK